MLNVVMLSVTFFNAMLNVVMLSVTIFNAKLNVIILSVRLSLVILSVVMITLRQNKLECLTLASGFRTSLTFESVGHHNVLHLLGILLNHKHQTFSKKVFVFCNIVSDEEKVL
jgi:hypothetical protein